MRVFIGLLTLTLLLVGCTKEEDGEITKEDFASVYGGKPFVGTAKGIQFQDGAEYYTWNGEGRLALIETTADSVSIVFMADFASEGEINFKVRGKFEGGRFHMETEDPQIFFRVADEKISGNLDNAAQDMSFEGTMKQEKVNMVMEVLFKEENGPFAKGSSLKLSFDASRQVTGDDEDGEGCKMRLVPIWGPNGMTMGMVPDC